MRGIWAGSLGLGLWISVTGAQAQENQWKPTSTGSGVAIAAPQPAAGSRLAAPRPAAAAVPARGAASVVSLGQPTAVSSVGASGQQTITDPRFRPVCFAPLPGEPKRLVVRAKGQDTPQPMPVGPGPLPSVAATDSADPVLTQPSGPPLKKGPPLQEDKGGSVSDKPGAPLEGPVIHDGGPLPWDGAGGDFGAVEGGDCGDGVCCDGGHGCWPGDCCCPTTHFWARAEYLIWNMKDNHYPALVTTVNPSSLINTGNPPSRGALGQAGTEVLFGGSIDPEEQSGGRFTVGGWLDACENWGLEGTYLFLGSRSVRFSDSFNGNPIAGASVPGCLAEPAGSK